MTESERYEFELEADSLDSTASKPAGRFLFVLSGATFHQIIFCDPCKVLERLRQQQSHHRAVRVTR